MTEESPFDFAFEPTITDQVNIQLETDTVTGIIKFIGPLVGADTDVFYGVELRSGTTGNSSGSIDGIEYFECDEPDTGMFVPRDRIVDVQIMDESLPRVTIGDRVELPEKGLGRIRYVGRPQFKDKSTIFYGIELSAPNGRHNGTYEDVFYFKAPTNTGTFVSLSKMKDLYRRAMSARRTGVSAVASPRARSSSPKTFHERVPSPSSPRSARNAFSNPSSPRTTGGIVPLVDTSSTSFVLPDGGRELREWMKQNDFWSPDLFLVIRKAGVFEPSDISRLDSESIADIRRIALSDYARQHHQRDKQHKHEKLLNRFVTVCERELERLAEEEKANEKVVSHDQVDAMVEKVGWKYAQRANVEDLVARGIVSPEHAKNIIGDQDVEDTDKELEKRKKEMANAIVFDKKKREEVREEMKEKADRQSLASEQLNAKFRGRPSVGTIVNRGVVEPEFAGHLHGEKEFNVAEQERLDRLEREAEEQRSLLTERERMHPKRESPSCVTCWF